MRNVSRWPRRPRKVQWPNLFLDFLTTQPSKTFPEKDAQHYFFGALSKIELLLTAFQY